MIDKRSNENFISPRMKTKAPQCTASVLRLSVVKCGSRTCPGPQLGESGRQKGDTIMPGAQPGCVVVLTRQWAVQAPHRDSEQRLCPHMGSVGPTLPTLLIAGDVLDSVQLTSKGSQIHHCPQRNLWDPTETAHVLSSPTPSSQCTYHCYRCRASAQSGSNVSTAGIKAHGGIAQILDDRSKILTTSGEKRALPAGEGAREAGQIYWAASGGDAPLDKGKPCLTVRVDQRRDTGTSL
ncbi:hypothetical protein CRENBAI_008967 [Crenichthys baileyi]|uniref:Uncharacterized protein n=1 Tax=Crenichthys baileyi TaxID=28760 RepID=A0AAV9RFW6_9TELE